MNHGAEGVTAFRLPPVLLRAAVLDCVLDRKKIDQTLHALWREDPAEVSAIYVDILRQRDDRLGCDPEGRHGLTAERMREMWQPLLSRAKQGLTITEMAQHVGFDREAIACALMHHGFLELVPFGGRDRRRLVTRKAEEAGLGHNPHGGRTHIARLEGYGRATPFPVFYPDRVEQILRTLDLPGIRASAVAIANKRARLRWLLDHHGYLPNKAIAEFAGCSEIGVRKARGRDRAKVSLQVIGAASGGDWVTLTAACWSPERSMGKVSLQVIGAKGLGMAALIVFRHGLIGDRYGCSALRATKVSLQVIGPIIGKKDRLTPLGHRPR